MQSRIGRLLIPLVAVSLGVVLAGCTSLEQELDKGIYAQIVTERGEIIAELTYKKTPLTVRNFVGLAEGTIAHSRDESDAFYDGLTFHRVVEDFVIQGGDPQGDGTGGPGYQIPDEFDPSLRHDAAGVLSMANRGPDTGGSQFFITLGPAPWLDDEHSVFGRVVRGMDVVRSIEEGDRIESVNIVRVGAEAKAFETDQQAFDEALAEARAAEARQQVQAVERQKQQIRSSFPNATKSDSGIYYVIRTEGDGPRPQEGDTVAVHYTGSLLNGMPFESTENREEPVRFTVGRGRVIPGWDRVLMDMREGGSRIAIVPPDLGFGASGARGLIPPHAYLVFDVQLIAVNPERNGDSSSSGG
jgi:peptidylprolyl isomerase